MKHTNAIVQIEDDKFTLLLRKNDVMTKQELVEFLLSFRGARIVIADDPDWDCLGIPRVGLAKGTSYFTSSVANWCRGSDPLDVLHRQQVADEMRKEKRKPQLYMAPNFCLWRVPLGAEEPINIDNFAPQVPGSEMLFKYVYPTHEITR